ncbi:hypothetical protein MRB53_039801 [Persea americana]|nr:hypothetical protein MRB53_039801 [Persea americana]
MQDQVTEVVKAAFTIACILVSLSILFILYRLSIQPRPILPSETKYETINAKEHIRHQTLPTLSDEAAVFLSVVIPAFNETERIRLMLTEAVDFLHEKLNDTWEILIVDDGSSDATTSITLQWAQEQLKSGKLDEGQLRVCTLEQNRGKGGAVIHGMLHHRGRYAIFADADGASRFEDVSLLLEAARDIERDGLSIAGGSRAHMVSTDAVVKRSPLRNVLMHGFHTFIACSE